MLNSDTTGPIVCPTPDDIAAQKEISI